MWPTAPTLLSATDERGKPALRTLKSSMNGSCWRRSAVGSPRTIPSLLERLLRRMWVMACHFQAWPWRRWRRLVLLEPSGSTAADGRRSVAGIRRRSRRRGKRRPLLPGSIACRWACPTSAERRYLQKWRPPALRRRSAGRGQAAVLGVEPQGRSVRSPGPAAATAAKRPMGKRQELPGAVAYGCLDGQRGAVFGVVSQPDRSTGPSLQDQGGLSSPTLPWWLSAVAVRHEQKWEARIRQLAHKCWLLLCLVSPEPIRPMRCLMPPG